MAERVRCCVPFCTHTTRRHEGEWVCEAHWKHLPLVRRQAFARAQKARKAALPGPHETGLVQGRAYSWVESAWREFSTVAAQEAYRRQAARAWRLWRRLRTMAIERAMGI